MSTKSNINFDPKHLKKGDPLPPYNGKLRLYNTRYCPFAHRVILAMLAKGLDFEVINVNVFEKPEWFFSKNPLGKVPTLEIEENVSMYESLVIVEYLDEAFPQKPLLPKDPKRKAFDKILLEVFSPVTGLYVKAMMAPDSITEDQISAFEKGLFSMQKELQNRGTKFFHGNEPGYIDYMLWPYLEKIWMLKDNILAFKAVGDDKYKLLIEYIERMYKDPPVVQYLVPVEAMLTVVEGLKTRNVNYDVLYKV